MFIFEELLIQKSIELQKFLKDCQNEGDTFMELNSDSRTIKYFLDWYNNKDTLEVPMWNEANRDFQIGDISFMWWVFGRFYGVHRKTKIIQNRSWIWMPFWIVVQSKSFILWSAQKWFRVEVFRSTIGFLDDNFQRIHDKLW